MKNFKHLIFLFFLLITFFQKIEASEAQGTGFFVTSDGYIATNYHVVSGATSVGVLLKNGKIVNARIVKKDIKNDLAIIKIDGNNYKSLSIEPSLNIKRGMKAYAMGFPMAERQGIEPKLTDGIISSLSGLDDEPTTFQITNPIQPGNSGGPLFSEQGRVIGIVSSTFSTVAVANAYGHLPQNVNFAIKSSYLSELLNTIEGIKLNQEPMPLSSRTKKFTDIVQDVDNATVLIIVALPNQPNPKPAPSNPSNKAKSQASPPESNAQGKQPDSKASFSECAIANDKNKYGTGCSKVSRKEAEDKAISNCGKSGGQNCSVIVHYSNGCMAIAKDRELDISAYAYGKKTLIEAKTESINSCLSHGGKNCVNTSNQICFFNGEFNNH